MTLVVTLPSLGVATTGIITGMLGDRIGKVRVLIGSLAVFGIAGVASFFATNIYVLLVERYIVGIGIGGIGGTSSALLSLYYQGEARVRALSYQTASMGIGVLILELGGGILAGLGWNGPFLIYSIGIIIVILALFSLREPEMPRFEGDVPQVSVRKDIIVTCYAAIFINNLLLFAIPSMLAAYIAEIQGGSDSLIAGLLLGTNGVVNAAMCIYYRRFILRFPRRYVLSLAWFLMAAGYILFLLPGNIIQILVSTCIVGIGIGLGTTVVLNLVTSAAPPHMSGKIMGGYSTFMNLGMFCSTFLTAAMVAFMGSYSGMYVAYGIIALVCAVVMLPIMVRIMRD